MRTLLALTAFSLITAVAPAQTNITLQSAGPNSCPIGVTAQHTPQGAVEQVSPSTPHPQLAYNITLRSLDTRLIRQARITLRGLAGAQITPAAQASEANAAETFTLTPGASPKPTFDSIVYTAKLTGVRFIEVDAITYADGTHWHQSQGSVCRVAPNGLLLVNATAH